MFEGTGWTEGQRTRGVGCGGGMRSSSSNNSSSSSSSNSNSSSNVVTHTHTHTHTNCRARWTHWPETHDSDTRVHSNTDANGIGGLSFRLTQNFLSPPSEWCKVRCKCTRRGLFSSAGTFPGSQVDVSTGKLSVRPRCCISITWSFQILLMLR